MSKDMSLFAKTVLSLTMVFQLASATVCRHAAAEELVSVRNQHGTMHNVYAKDGAGGVYKKTGSVLQNGHRAFLYRNASNDPRDDRAELLAEVPESVGQSLLAQSLETRGDNANIWYATANRYSQQQTQRRSQEAQQEQKEDTTLLAEMLIGADSVLRPATDTVNNAYKGASQVVETTLGAVKKPIDDGLSAVEEYLDKSEAQANKAGVPTTRNTSGYVIKEGPAVYVEQTDAIDRKWRNDYDAVMDKNNPRHNRREESNFARYADDYWYSRGETPRTASEKFSYRVYESYRMETMTPSEAAEYDRKSGTKQKVEMGVTFDNRVNGKTVYERTPAQPRGSMYPSNGWE